MGCERIDLPDGGTAILCSRGAKSRAKCQFCGLVVHTKLCDFPLLGKKAGKTCSKKMCDRCAAKVGDDRDLCPPHAKAVRDAAVPSSVLADPHPFAMSVALDICEQAGIATAPAFHPRDRADWDEFRRERAAIFEYLGGHPRELAERMALELSGPAPRYAHVGPLFSGAR
ncbi:MAG: hypothetical protein H0U52_06895 [Chloroflexi bacterium]|nr:hypothetical protein [Chloroflexota bacterium]